MSHLPRSTVLIACCAAALAAHAGPAVAAWTAPQDLPSSSGRYPIFAAYGAGGATSVGTYGPLPFVPGTPQAPVSISTTAAGAPYAAPAPLRDGLGAPIALSPGGTLLAVGGPRSPLDYFSLEHQRARLRVGIGAVGGPLRRIATPGIVGTRTLASAVNDRGDAAVVFSRCIDKSCAQRSVLATFRRRGRGFAKPVVLAGRTGYPTAAVALNARGDALVAWIEHRAHGSGNDVRTRLRLAGGSLTKLRIAGPTAPVPTIAATLTNGRHGTISWFSEAVGEGSVGGPLEISQVEMSSRGALGARHVLDSGTPTGHGESDAVRGARLRAFLGADGVATYAWTGFANGHYVVRAMRLQRDTGAVETLSPPNVDAQLMDVASDGAGDALVVWASVPAAPTTPVVAAVIRPARSTTFGASQLVLSGAGGSAAGAIAPGGRAIVAAGAEPALNDKDGPAVRVTQLLG